jgi:hypothetical protein
MGHTRQPTDQCQDRRLDLARLLERRHLPGPLGRVRAHLNVASQCLPLV